MKKLCSGRRLEWGSMNPELGKGKTKWVEIGWGKRVRGERREREWLTLLPTQRSAPGRWLSEWGQCPQSIWTERAAEPGQTETSPPSRRTGPRVSLAGRSQWTLQTPAKVYSWDIVEGETSTRGGGGELITIRNCFMDFNVHCVSCYWKDAHSKTSVRLCT